MIDRILAPCGHEHPIEWTSWTSARVGLLIYAGRIRCRGEIMHVYRRRGT